MLHALLLSLCLLSSSTAFLQDIVHRAEAQLQVLIAYTDSHVSPDKKHIMPRSIAKDGTVRMVGSHDWCSGFFPGELWYMYQLTGEEQWRKDAERETALLESVQWDKGSHDVGFMIYGSYGGGLRATGNEAYKPIIVQAAKSLITRYDEHVHSIKSWSWGGERWKFPVIVDNMMNLELLFEATRLSGDSTFHHIAVEHANTTLHHHFREDHSSYHVVDYDPTDGSVRRRMTFQGFADESVWSRGQAWGLYGFTLCYRYTKDRRYLRQAQDIARFFFSQPDLPTDLIPYWDMRDPAIKTDPTSVPRDASAATIMASALYELAGYSNRKEAKRYRKTAESILRSLYSGYMSAPGTNHGFLLMHATGNWPGHEEIDTSINYADYYFLEAVLRAME